MDAREKIHTLKTQLKSARDNRHDTDVNVLNLNQLVVNAVKGDPNLGHDSDLYDAMGYVRKSNRKSGLTRAPQAALPATAKN